jgi:hypothetical protein
MTVRVQHNAVHIPFLHSRNSLGFMDRPTNSLLTRRGAITTLGATLSTLVLGGSAGAAAPKKRATTTKKKRRTTPTTTPKTSSGSGVFQSSMELVVTWTYTAVESRGRIHNPYVGVWIEDADGVPVRIVHFEFQLDRGHKWLKDMKRWYRVDEIMVALGQQSSADTTTQATRVPGTYAVAWDGKNADGDFVAHGTYTVFVEAAREKGPYQYVKTAITIGDTPVTKQGEPTGDLTTVKLELRAKA